MKTMRLSSKLLRTAVWSMVLVLALFLASPREKAEAAALTKQRTVFNYLTKTLGLTPAAACGLMANAERESDFNPRATGDHGTSYGIFQWHASRFSALQSYCSSHGLDYHTMRGQLTYLGYEMETDYASVYRYLKTLDNDAYSAYKAGFYWCYHYERPAGYLSASVSRGELAREKYWPKYGKPTVEKPAILPDVPKLTGTSVSRVIPEGRRIELAGKVSSNVELLKVTAGFRLMNGNEVSIASVSPGETTYQLKYLAAQVHSESLAPGAYIFEVTAANSGGTEVLLRQTVTVLAGKGAQKEGNVQFLCVDNRSIAISAEGNRLFLTDNAQQASARFQIVEIEGGWYSVRSLSQNKYLTASADGRIVLKAWTGENSQLWQFPAAAGTMMALVPRSGEGKMLTLDGELVSGTAIRSGDGALNKTQLFRIVAVQDSAPIVRPKLSGTLAQTAVPPKMIMSGVTSPARGRIQAAWKKNSSVSGYEVQFSTSSRFPAKYRKTSVSRSSRTQKCTLKNCTSGRTYYVRLRAYRMVDGDKVTGPWSRVQKILVK